MGKSSLASSPAFVMVCVCVWWWDFSLSLLPLPSLFCRLLCVSPYNRPFVPFVFLKRRGGLSSAAVGSRCKVDFSQTFSRILTRVAS